MAKEIKMPSKYEVPDNWEWVELKGLVSILSGFSFKSSLFTDDDKNYPLIRIRDVVDGETNTYTTEECPEEYIVHRGDILIGMDGDFNIAKWRSRDAYLNQRVCKISSISNGLLNDYLYYFMPETLKKINDVTPSVTVKHLSIKTIEKISIPIPPLTEQQRIVEKIESLFSKLDEAKEKAQKAIDSYDMRVKSILDKAFRGEYSKKWRDNNKVSLEDWTDSHINEVCIPRAGFAFDSKKFTSEGYQVIRMGNLYAGELDLTRSPVFIAKEDVDNNVLSRSLVHDGDILITLTGTKYKRDYGYAVCIEGNPELLVNQRILCLTPTEKIDKDYLLFYLRSEGFRDIFFSCETGGVNQGNVSSKFVENIELKLPSIEEQQVIASLLKDIMNKEDQVKEISIGIVDEIDIMKKSILAKAFRGELGTNDSSDEPAEEMLKRILTETPVEEKKKSTTMRTKVKAVMNKDMLEAVKEAGRITPERLKEETGLGINEFYEELKRLTESGQVSEKREDGDVYLEVRDAN